MLHGKPTTVETPPKKINHITLRVREYLGADFEGGNDAEIMLKPLLNTVAVGGVDKKIIKKVTFFATVHDKTNKVKKFWVKVEAGDHHDEVNICWEGGGKLLHLEHMTVKKRGAFSDIKFTAKNDVPEDVKGFDKADLNMLISLSINKKNHEISAIDYQTKNPIFYKPVITCEVIPDTPLAGMTAAQQKAEAKKYRVGFSAAVLESKVEATYEDGSKIAMIYLSNIKDGHSNSYDEVFVVKPGAANQLVTDIKGLGQDNAVTLLWYDIPHQQMFTNQIYYKTYNNKLVPNPALPVRITNLKSMIIERTFRAWVVVQHKVTQEIHQINHVDWSINYKSNIKFNATRKKLITYDILNSKFEAEEKAGEKPLIIGGPLANDSWWEERIQ